MHSGSLPLLPNRGSGIHVDWVVFLASSGDRRLNECTHRFCSVSFFFFFSLLLFVLLFSFLFLVLFSFPLCFLFLPSFLRFPLLLFFLLASDLCQSRFSRRFFFLFCSPLSFSPLPLLPLLLETEFLNSLLVVQWQAFLRWCWRHGCGGKRTKDKDLESFQH
ncbi:hypothetical protein F5890DRAFT_1547329 [Lentinula detonsa]|uniref:Transmembrane protein n=1 Tax=Lentinula detonsa TaxID=2804962 RepID=A0AA38PPT3_9AGAR|nr:hypothetical protein F5890DRAFT_1547329 [Lentinula detonsa]